MFSFASQKNHISLYILKQEVMEATREFLKGASLGKGYIRYSKPEKIDFAVVSKMLKEGANTDNEIC